MTDGNPITVSAIDSTRLKEIHASQQLIAYTPFDTSSPWSETGPVYIHPTTCAGYRTTGELPDQMRTGPKLLRTYGSDDTLDYDHITLVDEGVDLEEPIRLLADDVATVHVRAVRSQCFGYSVTR